MNVRGSKEFGVSGLGKQFQPPPPGLPLGQPRVLVPAAIPARLSSQVSGWQESSSPAPGPGAAQAPTYLWCSLSRRWFCGDGSRA